MIRLTFAVLDLLRWRRSSETATNFILRQAQYKWNKANFAAIAIATAKNLTQFHVKFGGCSRLAATATTLIIVSLFFTSCNGQTSPSQPSNNTNSTTKKEHHPKIVRTLGTSCENVGCQLLDKDGNLWFGTKWFGLSRYDGKTFTTFSQYEN